MVSMQSSNAGGRLLSFAVLFFFSSILGVRCVIPHSSQVQFLTDASNWKYSQSRENIWTYNSTKHCYNYKGISCDRNGMIVSIALTKVGITGTIPSSIGDLTSLQKLYLSYNYFSSSIPSSIGGLTQLQTLWLGNNQLTGSIPSSVGSLINLRNLHLNNNQLSGSIPTSVTNLKKIFILGFSSNQLSGSIPSSIVNLKNLIELSIDSNQLTGTIPSNIGNLNKLVILSLYNNKFYGPIPSSIGSLNRLKYLFLDNNELSGTIPSTISQLISAETISLYNNYLYGTIPSFLSGWFYDPSTVNYNCLNYPSSLIEYKRPNSECDAFCGTSSTIAPCNAHGTCHSNAAGAFVCICDDGYDLVNKSCVLPN